MNRSLPPRRTGRPAHIAGAAPQRGVSLIFSLMTLVALSLAAVALIRSVDTGSTILGNLSFKQDTLLASDDATRQAITWLGNNIASATLFANSAADEGNGYSASHVAALDPQGGHLSPINTASTRPSENNNRVVIDWFDDNCSSYTSGSYSTCFEPAAELSLANGVKARYVILRLCNVAGDPSVGNISCPRPLNSSSSISSERGEINSSNPTRIGASTLTQYFRIIVRAQGPRQASSTTETLVHF